ncbi:MAG TPA: hypothetical protein VFA90_18975 [Terriglobales bacterium]|nr:hypothetical protein [Terriglobales bacterium]
MKNFPKSWIAIVAVIAAVGVLFVLITPAPDELPSTGPHSLNKVFTSLSAYFTLLPPEIFTGLQLRVVAFTSLIHEDLLLVTCARLC